MDHLCYLCLVFVIFSRLFIAALWSSEGKGLIFLALVGDVYFIFVTFPFGILGQVCCLILSIPDPFCLSYFVRYIIAYVTLKCYIIHYLLFDRYKQMLLNVKLFCQTLQLKVL